ncbi:Gfo/Idh/MocA family protein [Puniceicoccus vermicola]|uniref:Gfo/Idh/MocA family oxidoreductase n=1 Tax=Puniceicoccus vermicola TaxID=388746 RepID=A0A7X1E467_9BACT|nr:Gfo/Idh/MocA family oxidoreductase [Puniceicoccus vermicola]MBC2601714.1 Gfo/Idh/MocA family oxidoreductase [Puniceicoccus vermicola]
MPTRNIKAQHTLTVALVGVTGYANMYVDRLVSYHRNGRIRLQAATVINPSEASEACHVLHEIGCRIYSDFEKMIAEESGRIDLCAIPTGIHLHCPMTIAALNAGMNVLVEKPLTARADEARMMVEARNRSGLEIFVGFQTMFNRSLWETKDLLTRQKFGRVKMIKSIALWPRPTTYYTRNNWAGKLSVGPNTIFDSPVNNAMAHFVMMPLFLSGKDIENTASIVQLEADAFRAQNIESFDTFSARATTNNGIELLFNFSHSTQERYRPTIEVVCEGGTLQWFENENYRYPDPDKVSAHSTRIEPVDARTEMFENIFNRLQNRPGNCCTVDHAMAHTEFVNHLHHDLIVAEVPKNQISSEIRNGLSYSFVPGLGEQMFHSHQSGEILSQVIPNWIHELLNTIPVK